MLRNGYRRKTGASAAALAVLAGISGCREVEIAPTGSTSGDASATSASSTMANGPSATGSGAGSGGGSGGAGGAGASVSGSASASGPGSGGAGGGEAVTQCPASGDAAVGTNALIRVHSDEPIDTSTVALSSLQVVVGSVAIPGTIESDAHSLTFVPQDPLPANALVEIALSPSVLDDQGHALTDTLGASWSFTTASGPATGDGFVFTAPVSPHWVTIPCGSRSRWTARIRSSRGPQPAASC